MSIRKIDSRLHVTGQLLPEHMKQVADLGYKTIICMRPDREGPGQPDFAAVEKAAVGCGLTIHHIPVVPGRVNLD
ncbi:beta-lactamase hydrolase domain-containing protein [Peteryoungia ipomoeae]|nr:sulfur transferase domain-containing protein [Peteryoungia ipomoeae]